MAGTEERRTLSKEWRGTNYRRAFRQRWRGRNDKVNDGYITCGARIQNTPPLQALAGVLVVAPYGANSRLEALCSRAIAQVGQ